MFCSVPAVDVLAHLQRAQYLSGKAFLGLSSSVWSPKCLFHPTASKVSGREPNSRDVDRIKTATVAGTLVSNPRLGQK